MSFKKTIVLIIILGILIGIAYIINRQPQKAMEEIALFPDFDAEKSTSIRIDGPANKLTLTKEEGDKWIVVEEDNLQADTEQVNLALQTVSEIQKSNIISTNPAKQEIFQVDPNNGFEVEIKAGPDKILAHIYIGKSGPDFMSTYVRKADSDEVILNRGFHLRSRFDKPADAWLDKSITKFNETDINRIEFKRTDQSFIIVREGEKWQMETPEKSDVKEEMVNDMIMALTTLRAIKLQRLKPDTPLETFGLDAPLLDITISLSDGTSKTILIGNLDEKKDQYFVKAVDMDIIYSVGKYTIDKLNKPWEELKKEPPPPEEPKPETPESAEAVTDPNITENSPINNI